jgi:hypothetical protein
MGMDTDKEILSNVGQIDKCLDAEARKDSFVSYTGQFQQWTTFQRPYIPT